MKSEWKDYFSDLGLVDLFFDKAKETLDSCGGLALEAFEYVFVSEYLDSEGLRQYESLWMISDSFIMEAKNFLKEKEFDVDWTPFKMNVIYWNLKKEAYDFGLSTISSRMSLECKLENGMMCIFKASGKNCDHLNTLLRAVVLPNCKR